MLGGGRDGLLFADDALDVDLEDAAEMKSVMLLILLPLKSVVMLLARLLAAELLQEEDEEEEAEDRVCREHVEDETQQTEAVHWLQRVLTEVMP